MTHFPDPSKDQTPPFATPNGNKGKRNCIRSNSPYPRANNSSNRPRPRANANRDHWKHHSYPCWNVPAHQQMWGPTPTSRSRNCARREQYPQSCGDHQHIAGDGHQACHTHPPRTPTQGGAIPRGVPPFLLPGMAPQPDPPDPPPSPTMSTLHDTVHPESLAQHAADTTESELTAFPELYTLLDNNQGSMAQARFKRLSTLPLSKRPPLILCVERPNPHTPMLWGQQFVFPYFTHPTPEGRKILAFFLDIRNGQITDSIKIPAQWLDA